MPSTTSSTQRLLAEERDVKPTTKPLSGFTRLSPNVSVYNPPKATTTASHAASKSPTTILLCTWMNARPKHVEYYTRTYTRLYPRARIILVSINTGEFLFQSETRRRRDVGAAVTALLASVEVGTGYQEEEKERLLIHSFSNGGARRVYGIASAYAAATGGRARLPARAWLIDSAPGIPRFRRDVHALVVPARGLAWVPWAAYVVAVAAVAALVYVVVNWCPRWVWRELVWGPVEGMSDERVLGRRCARGYVYSREDRAIDWRDVERYAGVAERKGFVVMRQLVHGAEHVQLFRGEEGEEGYWGFMERLWARGLEMEMEVEVEVE